MIQTLTYRDRFTFPNLIEDVIPIAVVGGEFENPPIGTVDVGDVEVGQVISLGYGGGGYRDRFTFPAEGIIETPIAVVGGEFDAPPIGTVDVGDVSVGETYITRHAYAYRDRFTFDLTTLNP